MRFLLVAMPVVGLSAILASERWEPQAIQTTSDFRGLCAVSSDVAWVSGTKGTYGRTTDGGRTWSVGSIPGAEKLDFRDVKAFDDKIAYLLSAGTGTDSRIYRTNDGGANWELQFQNSDSDAFFDAMSFWDEKHGIALSDPVKGRFQLVATEDGKSWKSLPERSRPEALPKEGAFAASGTCLTTYGKVDVWFCTGGAKAARVFHSEDRGKSWSVSETPLAAGAESAGAFSLAFREGKEGMIVGGDYRKPNEAGAASAFTLDGGKTWTPGDKSLPFRSGVAWAGDRWIAVGNSGSSFSTDDGKTWKPIDMESFNAVSFSRTGAGWAAGPKGRIARLVKDSKPKTER